MSHKFSATTARKYDEHPGYSRRTLFAKDRELRQRARRAYAAEDTLRFIAAVIRDEGRRDPAWTLEQITTGVDPASGQARVVGPNPLEAGEPLAALVHTAEMGEAYDHARLDVADIGGGEDYDPANPEHGGWPYRFRVRAMADELDAELGPLGHASLYLDAAGARRLAAILRRRVDTAEGPGGTADQAARRGRGADV